MPEIWKAVDGFAELYEISDAGRLRRIATFGGSPRNKIIKPHVKWDGYQDYWLWKDGKKHRFRSHRLIWRMFVGPIPAGLCINHKNGVKGDNRLENLECVSLAENVRHGFRTLGRAAPNYPSPGEKNGSSKLKEPDVLEIRRLYAETAMLQKDLAKRFGVTQRMISLITRRENWTHI